MWLLRGILLAVVVLHAASMTALGDTPDKILRVYGPGGPHRVFEECADLFMASHNVAVEVIKALPHDLERRLPEDGDIYYGGAEYMLEEFNQLNPGVLNMSSLVELEPRQIGIVVRKGNPLDIKDPLDLTRSEVALLDVKLEKMRHFYGQSGDALRNVRRLAYTGRQGAKAWRDFPDIDAWVTYKTWYVLLADEADFIEIQSKHAYRNIPIVLTDRTPHQQEARAFISFLQSETASQIFKKHGWN